MINPDISVPGTTTSAGAAPTPAWTSPCSLQFELINLSLVPVYWMKAGN
jgi:hypothetical protein